MSSPSPTTGISAPVLSLTNFLSGIVRRFLGCPTQKREGLFIYLAISLNYRSWSETTWYVLADMVSVVVKQLPKLIDCLSAGVQRFAAGACDQSDDKVFRMIRRN